MGRGGVVRALAIDPTTKGFCYAVLESTERLVAWGCCRVRSRTPADRLSRITELARRYEPDVLVFEDLAGSRRGRAARDLVAGAKESAARRSFEIVTVTRGQVRLEFAASGTTKQEIAIAITRVFPELRRQLPPRRRTWMSEDDRMNVFDAISFALTAVPDIERRSAAS